MNLFALEDDSANEAVHHIDHIIELVTEKWSRLGLPGSGRPIWT